MYDEIWCPQLVRLLCKNGNDRYKHFSILHVCSTDESESNEFLVEETLSQVCSTDKDKSKGIIVDERSMDEGESECVHKNTNKEKSQRMRQSMSNLQLHMIQLSKSRAIWTYLNVERISWTGLTWRMNNISWPPQEKNTKRKFWRL